MVGGDWYDVIDLPSGRLALVIGDVQGHDLHAAGLMAQLRTAVHAYAAEGHGPDAVLSRAVALPGRAGRGPLRHLHLHRGRPGHRAPCTIARAGHPHPVLRMPDGTCMVKHIRGGLPLGLMPDDGRLPGQRSGAAARRDHDAVHGRADRDRWARHVQRLGTGAGRDVPRPDRRSGGHGRPADPERSVRPGGGRDGEERLAPAQRGRHRAAAAAPRRRGPAAGRSGAASWC